MLKLINLLPLILSMGIVKGPIDPYGATKLNVTIFSFFGSSKGGDYDNQDERGLITGHSFIQIKNISGSYLTVGHHGLYNNEYCTIGCWPTPVIPITIPSTGDIVGYDQLGAIWYNNEAHDTSGWQNHTCYSLSINTNTLGYEGICGFLTSGANSYYDLITHTCATVAAQIWNLVAPTALQLSPTFPNLPSSLKDEISTKPGYSINETFHTGTLWNYVESATGNLA